MVTQFTDAYLSQWASTSSEYSSLKDVTQEFAHKNHRNNKLAFFIDEGLHTEYYFVRNTWHQAIACSNDDIWSLLRHVYIYMYVCVCVTRYFILRTVLNSNSGLSYEITTRLVLCFVCLLSDTNRFCPYSSGSLHLYWYSWMLLLWDNSG